MTQVLSANFQASPILVQKALAGLIDLYRSPLFVDYLRFIGNLRKIKRLINTVVLLEVEQVDFDNTDINSYDLIHLLLIYLNYPDLFRQMYASETDGKRGFFSLVAPYEAGHSKSHAGTPSMVGQRDSYENSLRYKELVDRLAKSGADGEIFLLNQVFGADRLKSKSVEGVKRRSSEAMLVSISQMAVTGRFGE